MSDLTPEIAPEVIAACRANADEIAGALGRTFDGEFTVSVGDVADYSADSPTEGLDGPGLIVLLQFGDAAVIAALPESTGFVPPWCQAPDPTGESKLTTLAQELGMLLVPETIVADAFLAQRVESLSEALARGEPADGSKLAAVGLASGDSAGKLSVVWPLKNPGEILPPAEAPAAEAPAAAAPASPAPSPAEPAPAQTPNDSGAATSQKDIAQLPTYARSLLKVEVPINVRLASRKEGIREIVEMAAGSIIRFEKACDDLLELYVGDRPLAEGEAVKVGDKFGFRVTSMLLPNETFCAVRPDAQNSK